MSSLEPISAPEEHWDRLFAPSSCLAMITSHEASAGERPIPLGL